MRRRRQLPVPAVRWVGLLLLALLGAAAGAQFFELAPQPPAQEFGNLLLDQRSSAHGQKAVGFSHWSHRLRYACRVCHFELPFAMRLGETEITEERSRGGEFCGACHNGRIAFGHTAERCVTCHSGRRDAASERVAELGKLPKAAAGNRVDWSEAVRRRLVRPALSLDDPSYRALPFKESVEVEAGWSLIPPARFPHAEHLEWLDCAICHPALFQVRKRATGELSMKAILDGRFCGACHLTVAFPLDDCKRCHPKMRQR